MHIVIGLGVAGAAIGFAFFMGLGVGHKIAKRRFDKRLAKLERKTAIEVAAVGAVKRSLLPWRRD